MKIKNIISPQSLSGTGFLSVLVTIFIITPAIGSFWIYSEITQKQAELRKMEAQSLKYYKTILFNDVDNVMNFIAYKRSNTQKRVKEIVKQRVQDAYSLAAHFTSLNQLDRDGLKEKVIEVLRPIRWNNGKGYYFILNEQGNMVLNSDNPGMENQDTKISKDIDGKEISKDMVALANENDSGFYTYRWTKPGSPGANHEKITYLKRFKPFNWIICAGFYVEDMETSIKKEILARISKLTDKQEQYIFVLKKDGFLLYHPMAKYHRKNIFDHQSQDGRKIIQELINIGRSEQGGFIEYPWENPTTGKIEKKLSFTASVKDWGWTIGKGIYLDEVQKILEKEKRIFKGELKRNIFIIIGVSILLVLISLVLGGMITSRLYKGIHAFTVFFKKAADADIKINIGQLIFNEFKLLGTLANNMVEDRIQKEQALRHAMLETVNLQDMLKSITDAMPSSLIAIDHDWKVVHWNRKVEETSQVPAEKAEGQMVIDILALADNEIALIKETFETGMIGSLTRIKKQKKSHRHYEDMMVYPLVTGNINGAVIRIDNTTEKVRIEEMMIQSEKMLSVGGLAAGMAHEINNPLSGILGNIDVLKNRLDLELPVNLKAAKELEISFDKIRHYAEKRGLPQLINNIQQAGSRAAKIVSDMLSFSRMSTSNFTECNMVELIDNTIDLVSTSYDLKKKFDFKTIKINRHYDPNIPAVLCDSSKLQQVILNILSNGAHAMADNIGVRSPEYNLRLNMDDTHVTIQIADNGPGIPEDIRKRIFEPFFTTKEIGVGTGLGLSVSYFIITDHHKGTLEVESEVGKGTAFILRLPIRY